MNQNLAPLIRIKCPANNKLNRGLADEVRCYGGAIDRPLKLHFQSSGVSRTFSHILGLFGSSRSREVVNSGPYVV
jgi:hypothetical protein